MTGVNKVILIGNLGKDPEIRHLDNGRAVANFSLATSENYKNREGEKVTTTEWHNVVLWTPLAEIAEKYLNKGNQIYLEGKLTNRSYEDKEGNRKYITEVVGHNLTMLGGRASTPESSTPEESKSTPEENKIVSESAVTEEDQTDDLPF